jgi:hypothetical protein
MPQEQRLASLQLALEQKAAELAAAKSAQAEAATALAAAQAAASQAAAAAEPARAELAGRAAEAERAAEAAKAALGRARKEQEAEREKVKKAMGEMKRKLDRCCLQTIFLSLGTFSSPHSGLRNTLIAMERCHTTMGAAVSTCRRDLIVRLRAQRNWQKNWAAVHVPHCCLHCQHTM